MTAVILSTEEPFSIINFTTFFIISLYTPFHPAWIAAIIIFFESNINIGAQSAVKTPIGVFDLFVIKASPLDLLLVSFDFLSM